MSPRNSKNQCYNKSLCTAVRTSATGRASVCTNYYNKNQCHTAFKFDIKKLSIATAIESYRLYLMRGSGELTGQPFYRSDFTEFALVLKLKEYCDHFPSAEQS
ncbi:hypothetical protein ElyMa_005046100 [Elysia marginata]|uniref:Uncharacterized protein n=1 Tax=Elysia marginata TaxID=1093978 RepID=A0AAV4JDK5_9GAST|nr:hypothetical protein ElyMa_005046100 [Elysia marginata]